MLIYLSLLRLSTLPTSPTRSPWPSTAFKTSQQLYTPFTVKWGSNSSRVELIYIPGMGFPFLMAEPCAPHYLIPYRVVLSTEIGYHKIMPVTGGCFQGGVAVNIWPSVHVSCHIPHYSEPSACKAGEEAFWKCSWHLSLEVVTCRDGVPCYRLWYTLKIHSIGYVLNRWNNWGQEWRVRNWNSSAYHHFQWSTWGNLHFVFLQLWAL